MNAMNNSGPAGRIDGMSKAVGAMVSFGTTPDVYGFTKGWFFTRFSAECGPVLGKWLTWAAGVAEAWTIYSFAAFLFSYGVTAIVTWRAIKNFQDM